LMRHLIWGTQQRKSQRKSAQRSEISWFKYVIKKKTIMKNWICLFDLFQNSKC
jgi:hypothetical protein